MLNEERILLEIGSKSAGIFIPGKLLKICFWDEAAVLATLTDRWNELGRTKWFFCSTEEITQICFMDVRRQEKVVSHLVKKGYIKTRRQGMPSKRQISLVFKKILRDIKKSLENNGTKIPRKSGEIYSPPKTGGQAPQTPYRSLLLRNNSLTVALRKNEEKPENSQFLFREKKAKNTPYSEFDLECVKTLSTSLQKHQKISKQFSSKSWAIQFAKMRLLDTITENEISQVLQWYTTNIGKAFIPLVFSAKAFREKYVKLKTQYLKQLKTPITEKVKEIAQELKTQYPWPGHYTLSDIEEACQVCFNSYVKFWERLDAIKITKKNYPGSHRINRDAVREFRNRLGYHTPNASGFTHIWMVKLSDRTTKSRKKFDGPIKMLAWSGDICDWKFESILLAEVLGHGKDKEYWNILKGLYEA